MASLLISLAYNAFLTNTLDTTTPGPLRSELSGLAGSTSIACWIVLLVPQLVEQWRLKSAEGISIEFILLWFLGDLTNLIGSIWATLLPQVIFLAAWFCFADGLIISSYIYYTRIYNKHHHHHHIHGSNATHHDQHHQQQSQHHIHDAAQANEFSSLIDNERNRRRSSQKSRRTSINSIALEPESYSIYVKYLVPILFVIGAGCFGFFVSSPPSGNDDPSLTNPPDEDILIGPQVLGYLSAFLYLSARIPQIWYNYTKKSCKGLSLLFFIFSTIGNITYSLQIILYRSDLKYLELNCSWLIGSFGTVFEDAVIFLQFFLYKDNPENLDSEAIISTNNEVFSQN
ncbi:hypothetical protein PACTADRAFT_50692 [Pachysolen tannophilus NRRL Y-2460]|uniref:Uncharacterized protein n=1 Tax=Pachysolen tannophilus NRRL Y-2460 TaxID=669874 RepID=A0A1E4TSW9_PACTA|nr:hypothetical protein PACTADRAFT_50692 [Pachysolen tannophilus NRRL Y-2460]